MRCKFRQRRRTAPCRSRGDTTSVVKEGLKTRAIVKTQMFGNKPKVRAGIKLPNPLKRGAFGLIFIKQYSLKKVGLEQNNKPL